MSVLQLLGHRVNVELEANFSFPISFTYSTSDGANHGKISFFTAGPLWILQRKLQDILQPGVQPILSSALNFVLPSVCPLQRLHPAAHNMSLHAMLYLDYSRQQSRFMFDSFRQHTKDSARYSSVVRSTAFITLALVRSCIL